MLVGNLKAFLLAACCGCIWDDPTAPRICVRGAGSGALAPGIGCCLSHGPQVQGLHASRLFNAASAMLVAWDPKLG